MVTLLLTPSPPEVAQQIHAVATPIILQLAMASDDADVLRSATAYLRHEPRGHCCGGLNTFCCSGNDCRGVAWCDESKLEKVKPAPSLLPCAATIPCLQDPATSGRARNAVLGRCGAGDLAPGAAAAGAAATAAGHGGQR